MDGRRRRDLKETFDLGLGFIGFFAVAFLGITLYLEITRKDALWSSLTALVMIVFEVGLWFLRRSVLNHNDGPDGP